MAENTPAIPENQVWPMRAPIMEKVFTSAFAGRPIRILEIGVWFGVGSTKIWTTHCAPGSEVFLVDSWTPYSSSADLEDEGWDYGKVDDLSTDAFLSAFLSVKKIQAARKAEGVKVNMIRGDSASLLPTLADGIFDFIYIDGDHKYDRAKIDMQQAKRLIRKDFGVICGDDLEVHPTPELYEVAKQYPTRDFLRAPHNFHPGVVAAVHEEFGQVNLVNGFWWTCCINSNFTTEALAPVYEPVG